jgi:predicted DNA-binding protein
VSAIQVKNVPPELHERLRTRASSEGRNLSDYVLGLIEHDLALPTTREWLEQLKQGEPVTGVTSDRVVELIHAGQGERDEQIRSAVASH